MTPQLDLPPDTQQRVADTVELFVKLAGALGIVWAFLVKVAKPYREWRHRQLTAAIRTALQPELKVVSELAAANNSVSAKLMLALERQSEIFDEFDLFVVVVADNRDRMEEMKELLDEAGFASRDRRQHADRRRRADEAMEQLQGRLIARRRKEDELRNLGDVA